MSGSLRSAQLQREDRLCWNLIAHHFIFEKKNWEKIVHWTIFFYIKKSIGEQDKNCPKN